MSEKGLRTSARRSSENWKAKNGVIAILLTSYFLLLTFSPSWASSGGGAEKSTKKAFFLSLLVPGAGEFYAEERGLAKLFLGTEALIWASYLGFNKCGDWRRADYKSFARVHAGADPTGKPDSYFDDLKFYSSGWEYNRVIFLEEGPEAHLYPEDAIWEWDSRQSQQRYRSLRNSSKASYRYAVYMVGAAVVNHIISAIDAARVTRRLDHEKWEGESRSRFAFSYFLFPISVVLEVRW